ncbi:MAG: hypothetical protein WCT16_04190 [Candidatus Buchananbacteria bacterium]
MISALVVIVCLSVLAGSLLSIGVSRGFLKRKQFCCHNCGNFFKSFELFVSRCPYCHSHKVQQWKQGDVVQPDYPITIGISSIGSWFVSVKKWLKRR